METSQLPEKSAQEKEIENFKLMLQKEMIMREKNCIAEIMTILTKYNCVFTSKVEIAAQPLI